MQKSPSVRNRLDRLQAIVEAARKAAKDPSQRVTATGLARDLRVTRQTIQRDLAFLRRDRNAPIEYDRSRGSLVLAEPTWRLPDFETSEEELFLLALASQAASTFGHTPIGDSLHTLFQKIAARLGDEISLVPQLLPSQFSFHVTGVHEISSKTWGQVVRALRNGTYLDMDYRAAGYHGSKRYRVVPLHLACIQNDWYLVAQRQDKDEPFVYALWRTSNARAAKVQAPHVPFDPVKYFQARAQRFVPTGGRKPVRARVRFTSGTESWARERIWHPDQVVRPHRDGSTTVTLPLGSEREALRWVLQWGSQVEVLAPKALAEAVRAEARRMARGRVSPRRATRATARRG